MRGELQNGWSRIKAVVSKAWSLITATRITAAATVAVAFFAIGIYKLQKKELWANRKANIELVGVESVGMTRGSNALAQAVVLLANTAGYNALDVDFIQAHKPGGGQPWLGFLEGWRWPTRKPILRINIPERSDPVPALLTSQTLAEGHKMLCKEEKRAKEKIYFAFKVGWNNPNRSRGCKVWYLEIQCAPAGWTPKSKALFARSFDSWDPKFGAAPYFGQCPGEIFFWEFPPEPDK